MRTLLFVIAIALYVADAVSKYRLDKELDEFAEEMNKKGEGR